MYAFVPFMSARLFPQSFTFNSSTTKPRPQPSSIKYVWRVFSVDRWVDPIFSFEKKTHRQSQWRNSSHMVFFPGHIPYRNSRLTMLLKDSLGGDAKVQGPWWCFLGMGCWVCDFITFNKTNSSPLKINHPKHQFEGAVLVSGMVDILDFPRSNTCGTPVRRLSHVSGSETISKLNL